MAIKITCPSCETSYQVKGEAGGKKFRCKGCQTLIPVPLPDSNAAEDDWSELIEEAPAPPPRRRQKSEKKADKKAAAPSRGSRRRTRRELPGSVIGTAVLCVLGAALWFFFAKSAVGALQGPGLNLGNLQQANWPAVVFIVWGSLDVIVLFGVLFRLNAARILGIAVDILGFVGAMALIVLFIIKVSMLSSNLQPGQAIRWGAVIGTIVGFAVLALIWFIDYQLLTNSDTVEYVTGD